MSDWLNCDTSIPWCTSELLKGMNFWYPVQPGWISKNYQVGKFYQRLHTARSHLCNFFFFYNILFIYSGETERGRERSRLLWEVWYGIWSEDTGVAIWAEGSCSTAEPPRCPYVMCLKWQNYRNREYIEAASLWGSISRGRDRERGRSRLPLSRESNAGPYLRIWG